MTRAELIRRLAARFPHLTLQDIDVSVRVVLDKMARAMAQGGRVELRGFGSFGQSYRPPRTRRNPRNGMKVDVPAKYVPRFKPGKELRDRVDAA